MDELVSTVVNGLLAQRPDLAHQVPQVEDRRVLMRALMNVRAPGPVPPEVLAAQDEILRAEAAARGVVEVDTLPGIRVDPRLSIWRGDITRLRADAIVNAANAQLLGCFAPLHSCIDNAIHSAAGMQLREACAEIMSARGVPEPTGTATLTPGFNLPAAHVLHTVGPIVHGPLTAEHERLLASCYRSCLETAARAGLSSVVFCAISTGVFRFPKPRAAEIAVETVSAFLARPSSLRRVVFNVFSPTDEQYYRGLLGEDLVAA